MNVETGQRADGFRGDMAPFRWLAFSPDGKLLVTAGESGDQPFEVTVWDAKTRQQLYNLEGYQTRQFRGAISPDSRTLATYGSRAVSLWDLADSRNRQSFVPQLDANNVTVSNQCLAFSPDGLLGVSAGTADGNVMLCEAQLNNRPARSAATRGG